MDIRMANDEKMIQAWTYSVSKNGAYEKTSTLTVTNRRIISTERDRQTVGQTEIAIDDVKAIYAKKTRLSNAPGIIMIILGVLFAIAGIGLISEIEELSIIFVAPFLIFLGVGIALLNNGSFYLEIVTKELEGSSLLIGAVRSSGKNRIHPGTVKVKINFDVAEEIIATLGSIILDNKK